MFKRLRFSYEDVVTQFQFIDRYDRYIIVKNSEGVVVSDQAGDWNWYDLVRNTISPGEHAIVTVWFNRFAVQVGKEYEDPITSIDAMAQTENASMRIHKINIEQGMGRRRGVSIPVHGLRKIVNFASGRMPNEEKPLDAVLKIS